VTEGRSTAQRIDHARSLLQREADVWTATASAQGEAHLVPLSLSWDGSSIVLAAEARSATARNIAATGGVRLALGSTRDVVLIHASAIAMPCDEADESARATFVTRTGWNPISEAGEWVFIVAAPIRILVWQNVAEVRGRTVMRDGEWL
jgi:Pyridoxamine 5'-phosphate oxidase